MTLLLHEKAKSGGIYQDDPAAAEESIDDLLSCASIDILGNGSRQFYNKRNPSDPRNNKMCTVPVKLSFRDRETRFRAEMTLKKACGVHCGTPYPEKLRLLMDALVKDCKADKPGCFILAKVDLDKMCITAKARSVDGWIELERCSTIPNDLLDPTELAAATEGEEETEMVPVS